MISVGKTFLMPSGQNKEHLFFVILGPVDIEFLPRQQFLLVNATSIRPDIPYDDACILNAGDHPFINTTSYIAYRYARLETKNHLEQLLGIVLKPHADCSPELLERIIDGARKSRQIRKELKVLFL